MSATIADRVLAGLSLTRVRPGWSHPIDAAAALLPRLASAQPPWSAWLDLSAIVCGRARRIDPTPLPDPALDRAWRRVLDSACRRTRVAPGTARDQPPAGLAGWLVGQAGAAWHIGAGRVPTHADLLLALRRPVSPETLAAEQRSLERLIALLDPLEPLEAHL